MRTETIIEMNMILRKAKEAGLTTRKLRRDAMKATKKANKKAFRAELRKETI